MNFKIFLTIGMVAFLLSSCQKTKADSDIVSTRFVHKYGFDISEDQWKERGRVKK